MITLDYQPFSVVEDHGFRKLMETLESRSQISSRKHFSRSVVPKLYSVTRRHMEQALNHDLETVKSMSLTIDLWTSRKQESYISVTNHYLNCDFEMKNCTLKCSHFPVQHTGSAIYHKLCQLTSNWSISLPLTQIPIYVVSDNARNMNSVLTGKPVEHRSCAAHSLQLAVSDAVAKAGLDSLLKTCRSIVGHYKHSTKSREMLQSLQKKLRLPEHSLIQMVDTRRNSTYIMLERLHEQKEAVAADLPHCGKECLTAQEWNLIAGYVTILQPLFLATKELCRENVPTLSMVRESFINYISSRTGEQGSGIRLARALLKSLTARFHYIRDSRTHLIATTLDPRFMCVIMENHEELQAKRLLIEVSKKNNVLHHAVIDRDGDPLEWWKSCRNYPHLAELTMHYLSILATSVASERLFSKAGLTISTRHQNLSSSLAEKFVFLHDN
ncbi:hypothetical protein PR048_012424, partial [Dryococelus australis]